MLFQSITFLENTPTPVTFTEDEAILLHRTAESDLSPELREKFARLTPEEGEAIKAAGAEAQKHYGRT